MLKAVIFDFDGVVADSELLHYQTFNGAFAPFDVHIEKDAYYERYLGFSDVDGTAEIAKDHHLDLDKSQIAQILADKERLFGEIANDKSFIIAGVAEFVSMLQSNGIRIAVCSGALKHEIEMMLTKSDFADVFELIVAADDVSKGKPDPEPYLLTLERLNKPAPLNADECIVIEDSFWGLKSAKAAGMHPVGVTNTYPAEQLEEYSEKVVSCLTELDIVNMQELCAG